MNKYIVFFNHKNKRGFSRKDENPTLKFVNARVVEINELINLKAQYKHRKTPRLAYAYFGAE